MNLPNKITLTRFVMTLIFLALASVPESEDNSHLLIWRIGYIVAIVAGMTDFFDGYLARRFKMITDFGKMMDPLTDKIFTVSGFLVMVDQNLVPAWIAALILTREFAVTGLRAVAAAKGKIIAAGQLAKVKTVAQMLVLAAGGAGWVGWLPIELRGWVVWNAVLGVVVLITVYTGVEYFIKSRKYYMEDL